VGGGIMEEGHGGRSAGGKGGGDLQAVKFSAAC
jgi:hypothetical protein